MDKLKRLRARLLPTKTRCKVNESRLDADTFIAQPSALCTGRVNAGYLELIRSGAVEIGLESHEIEQIRAAAWRGYKCRLRCSRHAGTHTDIQGLFHAGDVQDRIYR